MSDYYTYVPGPEIWPVELYRRVVRAARMGDIIVEVGVGFGRSTCLMTQEMARVDCPAKLYAIDLFGTMADRDDEPMTFDLPWGEKAADWAKRVGAGRQIDHFDFYMAQNPHNAYLTDRVQFPPWHSAEEFRDRSVLFVMLNTSINQAAVSKQIERWWPKIKVGGTLAIYNGDHPAVMQAAVEQFKIRLSPLDVRDNTLTFNVTDSTA